jgi:Mn-containing catalase
MSGGALFSARPNSLIPQLSNERDSQTLLMDIGTEELSLLKVVGTLPSHAPEAYEGDRLAAETNPLIAIAGGGGVNLFNSRGNSWTADYLYNRRA